jgi:hypothetical protein
MPWQERSIHRNLKDTGKSFLEASGFVVVRGEDMNFMTVRGKLNGRINNQSLCSACIYQKQRTSVNL